MSAAASPAPPPDLSPCHRPYRPRGSAEQLFYAREPEVVMSGPAGTGKSRANLEKLHLCAEKYPGMRALIVRKTRASLTESALVTFEDKVLPEGHAALEGPTRSHRQAYRYPNGSSLVVGGLDKPTKVMSTEYDLIFVQEAIELSENEWESLTTRLRNGKLPYQQILADTNPDSPQHWLRRRANSGQVRMLESRHEDNPVLYDAGKGEWTPAGVSYLAKLDDLTGPRKARLRHGRWVQAEGVVYEGWDRAVHLVDAFEVPRDWPRLWVVDFGYTNPFVWQAWAQDPDGRLFRYREIYRTQTLVEDHARRIKELTRGEPEPVAVVCDHDAEDRATLERHLGLGTVAAKKDVSPGIQAVATRLRAAGDGKPRLFLMRDALDGRDPALDERKLPCSTEEEFDGYVWRSASKKGDEPEKKNDHGLDALRYAVVYADEGLIGWRPTAPDESNASVWADAPEGVFLR